MARAERLRTLLGEVSWGSAREKSAEAIVVTTLVERQEERRAEGLRNRLATQPLGDPKVCGNISPPIPWSGFSKGETTV